MSWWQIALIILGGVGIILAVLFYACLRLGDTDDD